MKEHFICGQKKFNKRYNHVPAPLFKKVFDFPFCREGVKLQIAVCGIYRLFLNGKEITKGYFAPYFSNPEQVVYYDEYCIKDYLQEKENILCVLLGNGFNNAIDCGIWDFETASFRSSPKFSLKVYDDSQTFLFSDESFLWTYSPILFDDIRCGEKYDANKEMDVYTANVAKYKKPLSVAGPKGILKQCKVESIKPFEKIKPVKIFKNEKGYIYDFGVNIAGTFLLNIVGEKDQKLDFYCAEAIRDNDLLLETVGFIYRWDMNYMHQHDEYFCKEGKQSYSPTFTYHGFRFIRVEGLKDEQATPDLLQAVVMHSDLSERGYFKTDNQTVNKIQECVMRSNFSNLYYFPTDCPHREKNGWTDDASFSAEQMNYNLNVGDTLREWLYNIRLCQKDSGIIPGIIPTTGWGYDWGNGPESDSVIVELPYQLYRFSGDISILEENATAIKKYLDFALTKENKDGLFQYGIGDWCEAGAKNEYSMSTPVEICDTLTVLMIFQTAKRIFDILERTEWSKKAESDIKRIKNNFRKKYVEEYGLINCKTQTAQAMGIVFDIFDKEEISVAYNNLISIIHENNDVMKVGVLGVKYLFDVLAQNGDIDLAFELVTQAKWPSYGYLVSVGATTLWEMFQHIDCLDDFKPYDCDGRSLSLNHHFYGCISAWFYRELAGINLIGNGYVEISPKFPQKLSHVEAKLELKNGSIKTVWDKYDDRVELQVENKGFTGVINVKGYKTQQNGELINGLTKYVLTKI